MKYVFFCLGKCSSVFNACTPALEKKIFFFFFLELYLYCPCCRIPAVAAIVLYSVASHDHQQLAASLVPPSLPSATISPWCHPLSLALTSLPGATAAPWCHHSSLVLHSLPSATSSPRPPSAYPQPCNLHGHQTQAFLRTTRNKVT